jgi:poly(beta-D-mannuronate) lyase
MSPEARRGDARTNGDPEAISLKSSGSTVRYNTIRNSAGSTLV